MITREGVSYRAEEKPKVNALAVLLGLAVLLPIYGFQGWALSVMWRWFVIPPTGWHPIGFATGAGLVVLSSLFWRTKGSLGTDGLPDGGSLGSCGTVLKSQVFRVTATLLSLGMGWVFQALR